MPFPFKYGPFLLEFFVVFYIGKYIGKAEFQKYPTIFACAQFHETLSDFHSVKSADFVLKCSFNLAQLQKMTRDPATPLNFAISEFSRHIEYDFLKEDHKNNFHTKNS